MDRKVRVFHLWAWKRDVRGAGVTYVPAGSLGNGLFLGRGFVDGNGVDRYNKIDNVCAFRTDVACGGRERPLDPGPERGTGLAELCGKITNTVILCHKLSEIPEFCNEPGGTVWLWDSWINQQVTSGGQAEKNH